MRYKYILLYSYIGFISAITSFFLGAFLPTFISKFNYPNSDVWDYLFYTPGLVFGIIFSVYFIWLIDKKNSFKRIILWIFFSTIAYIIAYNVSVFAYLLLIGNISQILSLSDFVIYIFSLMLGGSIGSAIVISGYSISWRSLQIKHFVFLIILGGFLSDSWLIYPDYGIFPQVFEKSAWYGSSYSGFLCLFLVWQTGMTTALGVIENKLQT